MRKILLAAIILLNTFTAYSQVQEVWAISHIAELRDQVVDANGNIYQASTAHSVAYDTDGTLTIKTDKDGNEIWRHFNPTLDLATTMTVDPSGNVYIAGAWSTLFTNAGSIPHIGDNLRYYVYKLNASGFFQWSNIYFENEDGEPYQVYGYPRSIVVDENGNPYVTGVLYSSLLSPQDSTTSDIATIKYNGPTGDRVWVRRFNGATPGTGFDEGHAMAIDPLGNIYVAGTSQLNGYMDIVTIKYNPAGNETWVQRYSNPDPNLKNDYAFRNGIKLDHVGNVFVGASSKAGEDLQGELGEGNRVIIKYTFTGFQLWVRERYIPYFSRGPIMIDNANNIIESSNAITRKYNPAGDLLWTITHHADGFVCDTDNNIYSVSGCQNTTTCGNYYGLTTRKLNSNGEQVWEKIYTWNTNRGLWIGIDAARNIYSSGTQGWTFFNYSGYVTIRYSQCEILIDDIRVSTEPGLCGATVNWGATTTGDCGDIIYQTSDGSISYTPGQFLDARHYHIEALSPSTGATKRFSIYVDDNQVPVMTYCPPGITRNNDPNQCFASGINPGLATATDNCPDDLTITGVRSDALALTANYPIGVTTITWKARDGFGNSATCTQLITVNDNQPPTITNESASVVILSPSNHTMRDVVINYTVGDNCPTTTATLSITSNEPVNGTGDGDTDPDWIVVNNHNVRLRAERSAQGNGRVYTITITAVDGSGNTTTRAVTVQVPHNIKNPHSGRAFVVNSTVNFEGEFWDKLTNWHTAKWLLDGSVAANGTVTEPTSSQKGKVTGSYKFTSPGVYKLQMNVIDQAGVVSYSNTNNDLEAIAVIYDPNGGYSYGGGWYPSQTGALVGSNATGKASFGYAVNYRNAAKPKGETQFEFKVGSFEFNALNFEYLVVAGAKAQFRGTGKITGNQSGFSFIMTVMDGALDGTGVDKIRMKIFRNNGQVVYDNQPGASEAANPTTAVGSNSIIFIQGTPVVPFTSSLNTQKVIEDDIIVLNKAEVIAYPNPSDKYFMIQVPSTKGMEAWLQVFDQHGRVIETRKNILPNSIIKIGELFRPGIYYLKIYQGNNQKVMKLVKL